MNRLVPLKETSANRPLKKAYIPRFKRIWAKNNRGFASLLEKIQPNAPFRSLKPAYVGYIQSFGPQKPNPHGSRAISLEKIQHTVRKCAKGAGTLHKIQFSRSGR
jgi:hypothetical protein